jgi:CDP-glycerol glycerophosphotransferase (TagB/SpsB family)
MRRVGRSGNIVIDREPSYLPLFARADALMSDASSFVLEFAATGKPLLYLHNPMGPQLNDDGDFVRDHCYWGQQEDQLRAFLDQTEAGEDPHGEARRDAFPQYMYRPKEGAGRAVKHAIIARLRCEAAPADHAGTGIGR